MAELCQTSPHHRTDACDGDVFTAKLSSRSLTRDQDYHSGLQITAHCRLPAHMSVLIGLCPSFSYGESLSCLMVLVLQTQLHPLRLPTAEGANSGEV